MKIINPIHPEKKITTIDRKIKIRDESFVYFIFVIFLEKIFARKRVRKSEIVPVIMIVRRMIPRFESESSGRICWIAIAAPVRAFCRE